MGLASVRTSLLPFWLLCRFLSGCPVVTTGTENRKEPQGLGEIVRTKRVHDVIPGSGTAVLHCVIVYSVARSYPKFWCCWEAARSPTCLFPSWWISLFTPAHIQQFSHINTHIFFHCPQWTHKQSDIAEGVM